MINWNDFISIPIAGGVIAYLYKKLNNKVSKDECCRIHETLDKRLDDMHSDIKMIKQRLIEGELCGKLGKDR